MNGLSSVLALLVMVGVTLILNSPAPAAAAGPERPRARPPPDASQATVGAGDLAAGLFHGSDSWVMYDRTGRPVDNPRSTGGFNGVPQPPAVWGSYAGLQWGSSAEPGPADTCPAGGSTAWGGCWHGDSMPYEKQTPGGASAARRARRVRAREGDDPRPEQGPRAPSDPTP